jgi:hypothetical protein
MKYSVAKMGEILNSRATHHNHGEGWVYTRDTGDLEHIRYKSDTTGYDHWTKRLGRALDPRDFFGRKRSSILHEYRGFFDRLYWWGIMFRVHIKKENHSPDGVLNGGSVITFWEEDGEYIQMVGPTVGVRIAEFLSAEPNNPHAIAIATEIDRIWSIAYPDEHKEEK